MKNFNKIIAFLNDSLFVTTLFIFFRAFGFGMLLASAFIFNNNAIGTLIAGIFIVIYSEYKLSIINMRA